MDVKRRPPWAGSRVIKVQGACMECLLVVSLPCLLFGNLIVRKQNLVELHSQFEKIILKRIFVAFGVPFKLFSLSILFSPCSLPILLPWSLLAWYLTLLVFLSGICVCMFVWVYVNLSCIYVYRLYISLNQLLTCTYREGDTRTFKHFLRGVILLHIKFEDCLQDLGWKIMKGGGRSSHTSFWKE